MQEVTNSRFDKIYYSHSVMNNWYIEVVKELQNM